MPGKAGQTRYYEGPQRMAFSYILTPLLFASRSICNRWLGPPYISGLLEANWLIRDFSQTQHHNRQTEPYVLLQITVNGPAPRCIPALPPPASRGTHSQVLRGQKLLSRELSELGLDQFVFVQVGFHGVVVLLFQRRHVVKAGPPAVSSLPRNEKALAQPWSACQKSAPCS